MWPKGELLTVQEAAQRVGRDPETIRRWIWKGKLRSIKVGGQHLIAPSAVDDALYFQEQRAAETRVAEPQATYTTASEELPTLTAEEREAIEEDIRRQLEGKHHDREGERKFREELFRKYGYMDVVQSVRDAREGLL